MIKSRRPLYQCTNNATANRYSAYLIYIFSFCILSFMALFIFNFHKFDETKILDGNQETNIRADNQEINWMNSTTIYEFKAQDINNRTIYLNQYR